MVPFALWIVLCLVFRGLGALQVEVFATWHDAVRYAFVGMFLFTGATHFTKMRDDYIRMVPQGFPSAKLLVHITGVCQVLGALGLLVPDTTRLAGTGLTMLLLAMTPANINAAQNQVSFRGRMPTPLWIRLPMQAVWIGAMLWCTWW